MTLTYTTKPSKRDLDLGQYIPRNIIIIIGKHALLKAYLATLYLQLGYTPRSNDLMTSYVQVNFAFRNQRGK